MYGESHPNVATRYNNLGLAYDTLGDAKTAFEYYTKALEIFMQFYGKEHPRTKTVAENLASIQKSK